MNPTGENRELPLSPGVFAYMQDTTKGSVKTYVGPTVINQTGQERPVKYEASRKQFSPCSLEQAVQPIIVAGEGDYVVLENPSKKQNEQFPPRGGVSQDQELQYGTRINIPGSTSFALWPGQVAKVIPGHNLHSNQYLLVRVYNEKAAQENWGKAKVITATTETSDDDVVATKSAEELHLTMGTLLIIKGTEVSFYIPPTGVEVVPDENGEYVREALTLERLEDCVLIDENGSKRYEHGPQVVFPKPTERFFEQNGSRKFQAIDCNEISGIHVKVIAGYEEGEQTFNEGDEIFIKGKKAPDDDDTVVACPIYHFRPEHTIIKHGDKDRHHATVIPPGEARYVMDRKKGIFEMVEGPTMYLPNPVSKVFVRRVLTDDQCILWYPGKNGTGSPEVLAYNRSMRTQIPGTGEGYVEERALLKAAMPAMFAAQYEAAIAETPQSQVTHRGTTYQKPRELTLDTKYEGVPRIGIYTGYAIMVVDSSGNRRVEIGPKTIKLKWDETLEVLSLSTGKPKNTDVLQRTVYLRIKNNKVSDIVEDVETKDHVKLSIKLSFRVNFVEEEKDQWFEVDNYVKLLCDHVRSMLKGMVRKVDVETFYGDGTAMIRDLLLGPSVDGERKGMHFPECGMIVEDVEVLLIKIEDQAVAQMLTETQRKMVSANIKLNEAQRELDVTRKSEDFARQTAEEKWKTNEVVLQLGILKTQKESEVLLAGIAAAIAQKEEERKRIESEQDNNDLKAQRELSRSKAQSEQELAIQKAHQDQLLAKLKAETDACVARFTSAQAGFSEALLALQSQETLTKIYQAGSVQRWIGGDSLVEALQSVFNGTPLADGVAKLTRMSVPGVRQ